MSASITMPMGDYSFTIGVADSDSIESSSGASATASIGGNTYCWLLKQTLIASGNSSLSTAGD